MKGDVKTIYTFKSINWWIGKRWWTLRIGINKSVVYLSLRILRKPNIRRVVTHIGLPDWKAHNHPEQWRHFHFAWWFFTLGIWVKIGSLIRSVSEWK